MQLEYMREFIVVVDCASFTLAANRLHITQPTLSRHILTLENDVGCKLISRSTHEVALSPEGEVMYREFSRILNIYDYALQEIDALRVTGKRILRFGVPYYDMGYVDKLSERLSADYPDVRLEIISLQPSSAFRALLAEEVDVVMVLHHRYPDMHEVVFHDFAQENLMFMASTAHPLAKKGRAPLECVSKNSLVMPRSNFFGNYVSELLREREIYPQSIVYTDSIETVPLELKREEKSRVAIAPDCVRRMSREGVAFIDMTDPITLSVALVFKRKNENPALGALLKAVDRAFA